MVPVRIAMIWFPFGDRVNSFPNALDLENDGKERNQRGHIRFFCKKQRHSDDTY